MSEHYENAFADSTEGCFRLLVDPVLANKRVQCPNPVVALGKLTDAHGKVHEVGACAEHAGELDEVEIPIVEAPTDVGDPSGTGPTPPD